MSRKLVDQYPCKHCGTPTDVERRRDIERATCERCAARAQACWQMDYRFRQATEKGKKGNQQETALLMLATWLDAEKCRLEAVAGGAKALELFPPHEQRTVLWNIRSSIRTTRKNLEFLLREVDCAEKELDLGFELIRGEAPGDSPCPGVRAPLALVPRRAP